MLHGALQPYEKSLAAGTSLRMLHHDGRITPLEIERWLAPADSVDMQALAHAASPALDVGCGPGRILAALTELGLLGLGIDIAATAVHLARERGLNVLHRSVFDRLPGEGRWASVLLIDGNIGIGGDPRRLLARCRQLLAPGGRLIVEVHQDPSEDHRVHARFCHGDQPIGPAFPWAQLGVDALQRHADELAVTVRTTVSVGTRCFAILERPA